MKMRFEFEIDTNKIAYFAIQKLIGIFFIVISVVLVKLMDGDATHCLILIPLGLGLFFTKHRYMDLEFLGLGRSEYDE